MRVTIHNLKVRAHVVGQVLQGHDRSAVADVVQQRRRERTEAVVDDVCDALEEDEVALIANGQLRQQTSAASSKDPADAVSWTVSAVLTPTDLCIILFSGRSDTYTSTFQPPNRRWRSMGRWTRLKRSKCSSSSHWDASKERVM